MCQEPDVGRENCGKYTKAVLARPWHLKPETPELKPAMKIWDRQQQTMVEEKVPAEFFLAGLYRPTWYFCCGWLLYGRALFSRITGWLARTAHSRRRIPRFIRDYQIAMEECLDSSESYSCFNDFFIRRLRPEVRPWDADPGALACPADCRGLFFAEIGENDRVQVKGIDFKISQLLGEEDAGPGKGGENSASRFMGGSVMIARLAPVDCHRFYFPAAGRREGHREIPGRYDSIHPLALRWRPGILATNSRCVTLLNLFNFGPAAMVEVGAFAVADIVQTHHQEEFGKMEEKGYFNLGGSSVVLVMAPGTVVWDDDLLEKSKAGIETKLRFGERLGGTCQPTI